MELPTQLTFHGVESSEALAAYIHRKANKLQTFSDRILTCRVSVESPQRHSRSAPVYCANVELKVPRAAIVIRREEREDVYAAIDAAFAHVGRRLQDYVTERGPHELRRRANRARRSMSPRVARQP